jgi:hypothetical protein
MALKAKAMAQQRRHTRKELESKVRGIFKGDPRLKTILDYRQEVFVLLDLISVKSNDEEVQDIASALFKLQAQLYGHYLDYIIPRQKSNTLDLIGLWLGLSRERIRQIEQKGVNTLKHPQNRYLIENIVDTIAIGEKEKLMMSAENV